jgi:hypothetical protein
MVALVEHPDQTRVVAVAQVQLAAQELHLLLEQVVMDRLTQLQDFQLLMQVEAVEHQIHIHQAEQVELVAVEQVAELELLAEQILAEAAVQVIHLELLAQQAVLAML